MDRQHTSFVLGARLKALREERGLSHVDLINQLNKKYGISVSRDSVMAYEISDETRAKASKLPNMGMRVETLYCLADFYGVSLDYLLGKTTVKAADCNMQYMSDYTGLSERILQKLNQKELESRQPPSGDELHMPNSTAVFIETFLDSKAGDRLSDYLVMIAELMLVEKRFWDREIEGHKSMSKRDQYAARNEWLHNSEKRKTYDFDQNVFNKIVNPGFCVELPVWYATDAQNYSAQNAIRRIFSMAKDRCLKILEDRVDAIEAWEQSEHYLEENSK